MKQRLSRLEAQFATLSTNLNTSNANFGNLTLQLQKTTRQLQETTSELYTDEVERLPRPLTYLYGGQLDNNQKLFLHYYTKKVHT